MPAITAFGCMKLIDSVFARQSLIVKLSPLHLFVALFCLYVLCGMLLSYPSPVSWNNCYFGADNGRAFLDFTQVDYNHYRVKVHPLLLILTQPVVQAVEGIVGHPAVALVLIEAAAGAGIVSLLFATCGLLGISNSIRILFSFILGLSFSNVIFSSIPETFIFAGLGLAGWWWFVTKASKGEGELSSTEIAVAVFFGIVSFGITITNFCWYLIGFVYLAWRRRASWKWLACGLGATACSIVVLALVQAEVWPQCPRFWDSVVASLAGEAKYEEFDYMGDILKEGGFFAWAKELFLRPLIASEIHASYQFDGKSIMIFGGYGSVAKIALVTFYLAFACVSIRLFASEGRMRGSFALFALVWVGNLLLHAAYGAIEAFIYSPHFLFALLASFAIAADALNGRARKVLILFLLLFLAVEITYNAAAFTRVTELTALFTGASVPAKRALFIAALAGFCCLAARFAYARFIALTPDSNHGADVVIHAAAIAYIALVALSTTFVFACW